jgi:hypothetical protein
MLTYPPILPFVDRSFIESRAGAIILSHKLPIFSLNLRGVPHKKIAYGEVV